MKKLLKSITAITVILAVISILVNIPAIKKCASGVKRKKRSGGNDCEGKASATDKKKRCAPEGPKSSKSTRPAIAGEADDADAKDGAKIIKTVGNGGGLCIDAPVIITVFMLPSIFNGNNLSKRPENSAVKALPAEKPVIGPAAGDMIDRVASAVSQAVAKAVRDRLKRK